MLTYQDFLEYSGSESSTADFIKEAIDDHETGEQYKIGAEAGEFYRHHDPYIEKLEKVIYDLNGEAHKDTFSPNHKIKSNFHYIFTTQLVSYLLGNGISFEDEAIKKQLGNSFDYAAQTLLAYAACDGESYGFCTKNGVIPFCYACDNKKPHFIPLKDEEDGTLKAGIRYWRLAEEKPLTATLYEIDGYSKFKESNETDREKRSLYLAQSKTPYNQKIVSNALQGDYIVEGENYSVLPIVPMSFINNQSSIIGVKETLVSYDLMLSNLVNDADSNLIYWVLKNCSAMDETDDMNFIINLFRTKVLHLENEVDAEPRQLQIQYQAKEAALTRLEQQLITDYMAVDTKSLRSGTVTTVEIRQAYENLNLKCDELEKHVGEFIRGVLRVYGYDENTPFHFNRAQNINQTEALQNALATAPYMGEEATTKEICEIKGKIDDFETIQKAKGAEEMERFRMAQAMTENATETVTTEEKEVVENG